jgi:hypothetical protein
MGSSLTSAPDGRKRWWCALDCASDRCRRLSLGAARATKIAITLSKRALIAFGLLAACSAAQAFGPKAHLWIGNQVLNELRAQCTLALAAKVYPVDTGLCQAITSNPDSFYAGVLGPDVYPDLIAGQNTTHSGVQDGWDTAEFLEHVVASAGAAPSRAYAAGFLVHAAGDVFGHSYVNAYAGDAWNLSDERRVELRHMVIEKYIDRHLPPSESGARAFRAPADFVRDALVHNDTTRAQYLRSAAHLAAMAKVKAIVGDLASRADSMLGVVPDVLAKSVESGVVLAAQVVDGEAALAVANAALQAGMGQAREKRAAVDREGSAVAEASGALRQHGDKMTELASLTQAQQQLAATAKASARDAISAANELRVQLAELENQILTVPPRIVVSVCQNVTDQICSTLCRAGSSNPMCALCNVPREVCAAVERVNDEYQRLSDQITGTKRRLEDLESVAARESAEADAAASRADALLQQQAAEAVIGGSLAAARAAAEAAYRGAVEQYRSIESAVAGMQGRVDELRVRVEESRKKLLDARAIANQVHNASAQLNVLSLLLRNWAKGIDHAGSAFVATSDRVGLGMLDGRMHLFHEYRRWLACDGAVYLAEPYQLADVPCAVETAAQRLQMLLHDMANVVLPEPLGALHRQLDDLKARVGVELRNAIVTATTDLVRFVSDETTAEFVDLLVNPEHATRAKLNEVLATADDAKGKELLVFENGADLIDRDLGLTDGVVDPNRFAALSSAVTLAKLALLGQAEIRALVHQVGGPEAGHAFDAGRYDVGRSILITAVRSLDGNEQWQPYGLLYPRSSGRQPQAEGSDRHFGFGPRDARHRGLPLFVDSGLRSRVFLKLFPRQIYGELAARPEMSPGRYPFPICERNPFPVTFLPGGEPAPVDNGCASVSPPM